MENLELKRGVCKRKVCLQAHVYDENKVQYEATHIDPSHRHVGAKQRAEKRLQRLFQADLERERSVSRVHGLFLGCFLAVRLEKRRCRLLMNAKKLVIIEKSNA